MKRNFIVKLIDNEWEVNEFGAVSGVIYKAESFKEVTNNMRNFLDYYFTECGGEIEFEIEDTKNGITKSFKAIGEMDEESEYEGEYTIFEKIG